MVRVFISYAHADKDYKDELVKHLITLQRNGEIEPWHDKMIMPGDIWDEAINSSLDNADLLIFLISPDFLASEYCYHIETTKAFKKHVENSAKIIPIIIRFCDWQSTPFSDLQVLPSTGKPIKAWKDRDAAFSDVIAGIKTSVQHINGQLQKHEPITVEVKEENSGIINNQEDLVADQMAKKDGTEVKQDKTTAVIPPKNDTPSLVYIPGGDFEMGSANGEGHEQPVHTVYVSSFHIGRYPVTVGEFRKFIKSTAYVTDAERDGASYIYDGQAYSKKDRVTWECDVPGNKRPPSDDDHPVIHVSWNDANAYCEWRCRISGKQYRLPTEAEWEYAAKGGPNHDGHRYSGSDDIESVAWYDGNSGNIDHPVGQRQPNGLGIYDMSGNIWEWCHDWYGANYYSEGAKKDPQGPPAGATRVVRGGSWFRGEAFHRTTFRRDSNPAVSVCFIGFRVVSE